MLPLEREGFPQALTNPPLHDLRHAIEVVARVDIELGPGECSVAFAMVSAGFTRSHRRDKPPQVPTLPPAATARALAKFSSA
jgi:hypothetical protein